jgi:uncharacterized repeat protein (TIGR01451 family)
MHAVFYQGQPIGRDYAAPVVVGMRPGYLYRLKLTGLPGRPGLTLYPTLEVRGSLTLPPRVNANSYPAPVVITETDVERVLAGGLVTKVVLLEHPERAVPANPRGDLVETEVLPDRDPLAEARERGRPMLVLRLGEREVSPVELAQQTVAGTILYPGETTMSWPRVKPCIPLSGPGFYDPILGPRPPEEECLRDGGDRGPRAALGPDGRLYGLDPEDTVAEFTDSSGRRSVVHSNTVCLCVPRYAILRSELAPGRYETVVGVGDARCTKAQEQIVARQPSHQADQFERLKAVQGRLRPSGTMATQVLDRFAKVEVINATEVLLGPALLLGTAEVRLLTEEQRTLLKRQVEFARILSGTTVLAATRQTVGTSVVGRVEGGPRVVEAVAETRDLTICCNEEPRPPDKPLVLCKWVDRTSAQVGDVVTFFLRYSNQGGQPITDVAISDSLTGRLEYVPGSARSDRDAVFTTQENEAGSLILRWEVSGRLLPGQKGVVSFQARVR